MNPERWQEIKPLFEAALALDPAEREHYLDEMTARDPEAAAEVRKLLVSDKEADSQGFLAGQPFNVKAQLPLEESQEPLRKGRIGHYEIKKCIGRGGTSVVYLAVRVEDFKQQVAIKLIKRGMETEDLLRRFHRERQLLAGLRHDHIAKLLDGGTTEDGLPYLVMEYIDGERLDEYCDRHRLPTIKRLQLFRTVCLAVHFAHQNLVVHRDLKPSNLLVMADGVPKLVDFGIAKLLNPELSSETIEPTHTQSRMLTPEYASPEQIRGERITTTSDVYSLGVVLYELLTGHRPYQLPSRLGPDLARVVCEQEPEQPSAVVRRPVEVRQPDGTTVTLTPEKVSATRGGRPEALRRTLKGDLDNIVLKALKKLPEERYQSAEQLAGDIQRYLDGLPVLARRDTVVYRMRKFVKRHRVGVAAAGLVGLSLVGGMAATTLAMRQAREQEARAREQQGRAERAEQQASQLLAEFARVSEENLLNMPGAYELRKGVLETTLQYHKRFLEEHQGDPNLKADVAAADFRVAQIYAYTGAWQDVLRYFLAGLLILEQLVQQDANVAGHKDFLAGIYRGRLRELDSPLRSAPDAVQIAPVLERARRVWETLVEANPGALGFRNDLAGIYNIMGIVQRTNEDYQEALRSFRKARDIWQQLVETTPGNANFRSDWATTYGNTADVYWNGLKQPKQALVDTEKARDISDQLVSSNPGTFSFRDDQAWIHRDLARYQKADNQPAEARKAFRKAREIWKDLIRYFPDVYSYHRSLANADAEFADLIPEDRDRLLYEAACSYAQCARLIVPGPGKDNLTEDEVKRRHDHKTTAIKLLQEIAARGYFEAPANLANLKENSDLNPLRNLDAFQKLLTDVSAKTPNERDKASGAPIDP